MPTPRPARTPPAAALAAGIALTLTAVLAAGAGQPRPTPPRWEYATLHRSSGGQPLLIRGQQEIVGHDQVGQALSLGRGFLEEGQAINALGSVGWELISVVQDPDSDALQFRFKRPL